MGEEDDSLRKSSPGDPAAAGIALASVLDPRAAAYLAEQTRLARLQAENLIEQNAFELSHLRWRRFNDQMKGALQIMAVALGLAVVGGLLAAVWNASRADGIVVEAFSVPPALAQNGIGGDIVADDLTNKIAAIRDFANANSLARSKSVRQDRDKDIKVEIPETGVSLAQAWRYLRLWFGNERPLSGNVRLLDGGRIALTLVLDGEIFRFTGAPRDLDALEDAAAERIFAAVDPTNYVLYLFGKNRFAEGYAAAARNVALAPDDFSRGGAFSLWANATHYSAGDLALAYARASMAVALAPKSTSGHMELLSVALALGHDEDGLRQARIIATQRKADEAPSFQERGYAYAQDVAHFARDSVLGDFTQGLVEHCDAGCTLGILKLRRAEYAARLHDPMASDVLFADGLAAGQASATRQARTRYFAAVARGDWPAGVRAARTYAAALAAENAPVPRLGAALVANVATPLLSVALAHAGDVAGAQAAVAATPLDCYDCLRARGRVAALRQDTSGAQAWFARAVAAAPSIPFAYADWGEMLLRRGDFGAAISKFDLAHQKGPHFADPLELWGEALVATNRSDLAIAKYAEVARYAPNWGRLHLKWGEALLWLGRQDDAKKQLAAAAALFLTPAETRILRTLSGKV